MQLDLFKAIHEAYVDADGELTNAALYDAVAKKLALPATALAHREPVGNSGQRHNLLKRSIRWWQQNAKMQGLLERDGGQRGLWRLTRHKKTTLTLADVNLQQVAFSTELGIAIWARCECVAALDEPVALCVTSPPYPGIARAYGTINVADYIDWVCTALHPYVKSLAKGGSLALNVGNNLFLPGTPGRSSYWWKLGLAIEERFGLVLMDTLCWHNTSAAPTPLKWASESRQQLNATWEPVLSIDRAECSLH